MPLFPFEEITVKAIFTALSQTSFLKPVVFFLGSVLPWIITAWFVVRVLRARSFKLRFYYLSLVSLGVIISRGLVTQALYAFFYFPRPFELFNMDPIIPHALKSGMPSGHMAFLIPIALTFICVRKKQGLIALSLVIAVGAARVMAGVHWVTDIIAGILVGVAGFLIAKALLPQKLSIGIAEPPQIDDSKSLV